MSQKLQKALKIFSNRTKYTNCYMSYNDFVNLLDICEICIRGNSLFLLKSEDKFLRFYYFINDYNELNNLEDFLNMYDVPIVLEVVSKEEVENEIYKKINFYPYKVYSRYFVTKSLKKATKIVLAEKSDILEIKKLLDQEFDPLSDYIPSKDELNRLVEKKELFITRRNDTISSIAIYQKMGLKLYYRLLLVHPDYRTGFLGYNHALKSLDNDGYAYAWVDDENIPPSKLIMAVGYKKDGLKNHIFLYHKI